MKNMLLKFLGALSVFINFASYLSEFFKNKIVLVLTVIAVMGLSLGSYFLFGEMGFLIFTSIIAFITVLMSALAKSKNFVEEKKEKLESQIEKKS